MLPPLSKLFCASVCVCISVHFVMTLGEPHPTQNHLWLFIFFFLSLCLCSCDDFTELRNLKLSLELQPDSEKPINSSFKRFVSLRVFFCVCMRCAYSRASTVSCFPWTSSLSAWHIVSASSHGLQYERLGWLKLVQRNACKPQSVYK